MKVILYGSTGMVGSATLIECLEDSAISDVLVLNRSSCGVKHEKLKEITMPDFLDYSDVESQLKGYDACLYCLGVSSSGMKEEDYRRITYDFTMAAAAALKQANPNMAMCFVSGAGTDSSEAGRTMWARVKGKAENDLLAFGFARAHMFRPAFIQPKKGVKSKTPLYNNLITLFRPIFPLIKLIGPKYITESDKVGRAMIRAAREGYEKPVLESIDINKLADRAVA
jgi:uncharacterized protein YbjT (DUF2867 family)